MARRAKKPKSKAGKKPVGKPSRKPKQKRKKQAPTQGELAARIVAAPVLGDAKAAHARVNAFLGGAGAAGRKLKNIFAKHPRTLALAEGLAEHSPFLWE